MCVVDAGTMVSPQVGTVLITEGGMASTVICWAIAPLVITTPAMMAVRVVIANLFMLLLLLSVFRFCQKKIELFGDPCTGLRISSDVLSNVATTTP
jgi:hypothetical protein